MIHVPPVLDGDDRLLYSLGYLARLEDDRAPTVRVPSRCPPRHHHLRSGDENAEVLALQVPDRCKLGRTAVSWRDHPTQEHSTSTEDSLQQSVAHRRIKGRPGQSCVRVGPSTRGDTCEAPGPASQWMQLSRSRV